MLILPETDKAFSILQGCRSNSAGKKMVSDVKVEAARKQIVYAIEFAQDVVTVLLFSPPDPLATHDWQLQLDMVLFAI